MIATFGSETEGGDRADADAPLCARGISPNWNAEGKYEPNDIQPEPKEITRSAKCLVIDKPGLLDTLCWVDESVRSLAAHEVLVETRAVGLNFRDVMVAMEVLKFGNPNALGRELSGVVREVGSEVSGVQVGDRVCGLHADGCFSTRAIMLDSLVIRMPGGLEFQEAATMPACYTTAIQALVEVARLKSYQVCFCPVACSCSGA
jgi:D-arabinose 1-dehydrogenase-like Zn-dependent alcohol dehydrogenase